MSDNFKKVVDVLGFEPTKRQPTTTDILSKVQIKLQQERLEAAEQKAEQVMREVIELCEKRNQAVKQFEQQQAKFDKELGKLLNQLQPKPEQPETNQMFPVDVSDKTPV